MDSKIEFNELCRLCLAKNHVGIPIFEGEGHDEVFLKISTCLPVNISYEDKLPKRICTNCLNKLNILYKFCNKSANSEKQLLDWFNQYGTANETSIDSNADYETAQSDSEIEIKEEALSFLTDEDDNIKIEDTDMENYNILQDIPKQGNDISNEQCSDTIGFNAVTNGTEVEVKQENDDDDDGKPKTTNLQPEVNTKYAKMLERRAKMDVNENNEDSQLHFENDLNCNLMNNNVIYELEVMAENENLTASANLNIDLMTTHNNINLPQMEVFQDEIPPASAASENQHAGEDRGHSKHAERATTSKTTSLKISNTGILKTSCIFCNRLYIYKNKKLIRLSTCKTRNFEANIKHFAVALNDQQLLSKIKDVDFIAKEIRYHGLCRSNYSLKFKKLTKQININQEY